MKTGNIHQYKQQLYRLNATKIRKTQSKPKQYIRKPIIQEDVLIHKTDKNDDMLKEMSERLKQIEQKRKQSEIMFLEKFFKVTFTEEEKQKLMLYM